MFKAVYHILLLFCLVLFGANSALSVDKQGPKAVISNPEFDFKEVKQGEIVQHTFIIENRGDLPLKVLSVRPG